MFELSAGQIVADKYRIDGIMGTGGMGVVVAATHVDLDQRVAIKFLREVSPEALARFQREARLLVRLKSPHVARVFDVGALDDDTPYIVMEHLDGDDLATIASDRGKLPVEETVDYVVQAMEAVAEAHALGMVHRDLKPANLFLAKGPGGTTTVKVLDFGVSKILDDRSTGANDAPRGGDLTNEGVALGSPGYMSPEQMTSARDVDERSDIFSFGALLYRLVGGQNPYKGTSVVSILAAMATQPLLSLRKLAPDAPEVFAAIVERCLAHDKAARFPTVAHLAHALTPFASRRGRMSIEQILATLNITFPDDTFGETRVHGSAPSSGPLSHPSRPGSRPGSFPPPVSSHPSHPTHPGAPQPLSSRPGSRPSSRPNDHTLAMPPAPTSGPPRLGPQMGTGPHFTVSAPAAAPPMFINAASANAPRKIPLQFLTIGITLAVLGGLFGGLFLWRALVSKPRAERGDATPTSAMSGELGVAPSETTSVPTAAPSAVPIPIPSGVTSPTTTVSPFVAAVPDPSSTAPADSTGVKPRPSGAIRPRPHPSATHTAAVGTGPSPAPNPTDVPGGRH